MGMKWKNRTSLILLALMILGLCSFTACTKQSSQEKCIEQMLVKWSEKQPKYLSEAFFKSFETIGIGQTKKAEQSAIDAINAAVIKEYDKYFTEKGLEMFRTNFLAVPILAQEAEISLAIENLKITNDSEYKFECDINCTSENFDIENKTIFIAGKINFKDDKINWIKLTEGEELLEYINIYWHS